MPGFAAIVAATASRTSASAGPANPRMRHERCSRARWRVSACGTPSRIAQRLEAAVPDREPVVVRCDPRVPEVGQPAADPDPLPHHGGERTGCFERGMADRDAVPDAVFAVYDSDLSDRLHERLERLEDFYQRRGELFQVVAGSPSPRGARGPRAAPAPGPGRMVVVLGLGMLAPAFGWARTLLRRAIELGDRFHEWSEATPARTLRGRASSASSGRCSASPSAVWSFVR